VTTGESAAAQAALAAGRRIGQRGQPIGNHYRLACGATVGQRWGSKVLRWFSRFAADRSAATSIEYALIAVGISLAIIVAVQNIGPTVSNKYTVVNGQIK
jgi:pilus assembly protein Flp/PilA